MATTNKLIISFAVIILFSCSPKVLAQQWSTNGDNISNTNTGKVGIGTPSPIYSLDVNGGANGFRAKAATVSSSDAIATFENANGLQAVFRGNGNLGLGTSGPNYRLDVQGGQINASGGLCIAGDCKTAWPQGGGTSQWTTSGSSIYYNTGNVGIGTDAPLHKLEIAGGGSVIGFAPGNTSSYGNNAVLNRIVARSNYGAVDISSAAEIKFLTGSDAWYKGSIAFFTNDVDSTASAAVERMRISNAGNIGIGTTSPTDKLHVAGGTRVDGTNGRVYLGTTAPTNARGLEIIEENATTFSLRHHDPNVAWQNIVINPHGGNVGIGTLSPTTKLHIAGDGKVTGNLTVDGNIAAKYQDVAEWVPAVQALPAGTVVTLNRTQSNLVEASSKPYDTGVAGVISAQPGITLGERGENKVLVATTGRVRIKVDASNGPIQIGDLLVTSDVAGVAMKSQPIRVGGVQIHRPGTLIGKALEPLAKGTGEILMLLSLQ